MNALLSFLLTKREWLALDLWMTVLLSSLLTKREWLALSYFFFKGANIFRTFKNVILKIITVMSSVLKSFKRFCNRHRNLSIIYKKTDERYIEWQRVTTIDSEWNNEWQWVTKSSTTSKNGKVYFNEWMIAILSIIKIDALLQGMDGWY